MSSRGTANTIIGRICTTAVVAAFKFLQLDVSLCTNTQVTVEQAEAGGKIYGISSEAHTTAARPIGLAQGSNGGEYVLLVNGNSVNIAAGDRLKSDANGFGVKAAADLDEYGAIALAPATADSVVIPVTLVSGTLSVA